MLQPAIMCAEAPTAAQAEWGRCRSWIVAALATSPGLETIEDVERLIGEGRYQFWAGGRSAAITEVAHYARRKALVVVHGGGDLGELMDEIEPAMCAYARAQGCNLMMGTGRKGWEKVTGKRGYRFGYITMIKDLKI